VQLAASHDDPNLGPRYPPPLPEASLTYPSSPGSVRARQILLRLGFTAAVAGAGACHPDEPTNVAELDVVATAHEDSVNYGAIATYVMPDSVVAVVPPESVLTLAPAFSSRPTTARASAAVIPRG